MEDYQVSDVSMAINVKGMSFDQMKQEVDCIRLSVQGALHKGSSNMLFKHL